MIASSVSALWVLLLLACPLMMFFMMRGGHGHGHGQSQSNAPASHDVWTGNGKDAADQRPSLEELRTRLDDLEVQIRAREDEEAERPAAR